MDMQDPVAQLLAQGIRSELVDGERKILTIDNGVVGDSVRGRYATYMVFLPPEVAKTLEHPDVLEQKLREYFSQEIHHCAVFVRSNRLFGRDPEGKLVGIMQIGIVIETTNTGPSADTIQNYVAQALGIREMIR